MGHKQAVNSFIEEVSRARARRILEQYSYTDKVLTHILQRWVSRARARRVCEQYRYTNKLQTHLLKEYQGGGKEGM